MVSKNVFATRTAPGNGVEVVPVATTCVKSVWRGLEAGLDGYLTSLECLPKQLAKFVPPRQK